MFETEASEKANKKYPIPKVCNGLDVARNRKYEEGFKDGAEFIYKGPVTKAKDVIEKLLNAFASNNFFEEEELSAMEEAEQFLKEVGE